MRFLYIKNISKLLIISILTTFPSLCTASSFLKETLLEEDIAELQDAHTTHYSQILRQDAHVYTFDETIFNRLFPIYPQDQAIDQSIFVGQIRNTVGNGTGTGTLLEIKEEAGKFKGIGITALHNFVGYIDGSLAIVGAFQKSFFPGSKVADLQSSKINELGSMSIDTVKIQRNISKDICLFEGEFIPNPSLFPIAGSFEIPAPLPCITGSEIEADQQAVIYHYPLGKKEQRKNTGLMKTNKLHKLRTLYGSSGAAIFSISTNEVIGIHTGTPVSSL